MYLSSHSYYSLRYGTIPPEELLQLAAENNINSLALTDINNTSACLDFIRLSKKYNIRPVIGIDFRNGVKQQFIGLAKNNEGYYELNLYLSKFFESGDPHPEKAPSFQNAFIIYPFNHTERSFGIEDLNENYFHIKKPNIVFEIHECFYKNNKNLKYLKSILESANYNLRLDKNNLICLQN